ncbi:hypothetical protein ABH973_003753 [Bradyrhizobium ottawaense]
MQITYALQPLLNERYWKIAETQAHVTATSWAIVPTICKVHIVLAACSVNKPLRIRTRDKPYPEREAPAWHTIVRLAKPAALQ